MSAVAPVMMGVTFTSRSPEETRKLGARLARVLPDGTVVALVGALGAGKTVLVQGAAEGLGVAAPAGRVRRGKPGMGDEEDVTSPTFVLVRVHEGTSGRKLVHVDAHRLSGARDLAEIGSNDFLGRGALAFVEWADRVYDALPRPCLVIRMSHESEEARRLELGGLGPGHEGLVELAARILVGGEERLG